MKKPKTFQSGKESFERFFVTSEVNKNNEVEYFLAV